MRCESLFKRFFQFEAETAAIHTVGDKTHETITAVLKAIKETLSDTGRYREAVEDLQGTLDQPVTMDRLRVLIASIVAESRTIASEQQQMRQQLDQAAEELARLRAALDKVRRQAETDSLTGIANRRAFDRRLDETLAAARQARTALSVLVFDIDHFKLFNDTFGHSVGDQVLKLVAGLLDRAAKPHGECARYGGEEFAIVFPGRDLSSAMALAETIRGSLANRQIASREGGPNYGTVTLSVGVAQWSPGESASKLMERADEALYRAKREGRNRVASAGP